MGLLPFRVGEIGRFQAFKPFAVFEMAFGAMFCIQSGGPSACALAFSGLGGGFKPGERDENGNGNNNYTESQWFPHWCLYSPRKKCGAGFQPARSRRVRQVGNLPHTFSSFQGVARDMDDSSENVGQDGILSHGFSSFLARVQRTRE